MIDIGIAQQAETRIAELLKKNLAKLSLSCSIGVDAIIRHVNFKIEDSVVVSNRHGIIPLGNNLQCGIHCSDLLRVSFCRPLGGPKFFVELAAAEGRNGGHDNAGAWRPIKCHVDQRVVANDEFVVVHVTPNVIRSGECQDHIGTMLSNRRAELVNHLTDRNPADRLVVCIADSAEL